MRTPSVELWTRAGFSPQEIRAMGTKMRLRRCLLIASPISFLCGIAIGLVLDPLPNRFEPALFLGQRYT